MTTLSGGRNKIEIIAAVIFCLSLFAILAYIRLLLYISLASWIFHALFISSIAASTILILSRRLGSFIKLAVAIAWVVCLQLAVPLRFADDLLSNSPDAWYLKQIVDHIITTASSPLGIGTGQAIQYSFYPGYQLFVAMVTVITGVNEISAMKYLPALLSIPFLIILYRFFQNFVSVQDSLASTQVAGSCFWIINFFSQPVQSTFGIFFVSMAFLALTRRSNSWTALVMIATVGMVISHLLSALYFVIFLVLAKSYSVFSRAVSKQVFSLDLSYSRIAMVVMIILVWLFFPALSSSANLSLQLGFALYLIPLGKPGVVLLGTTANNPIAPRIAGDIGITLYGALLSAGFFLIRKTDLSLRRLLPYAFASAGIFVFNVVLFSLQSTQEDIFPRGFVFLYLISSPLAIFTVSRFQRQIGPKPNEPLLGPINKKSPGSSRRYLTYILIALILVPSMYYYYPAFRYDNGAPMVSEDVRLPLEEWKVVGQWSSAFVPIQSIHGDKLAYDFIGSIGSKDVVLYPHRGDIISWTQSRPIGTIAVLRISAPQAPYENFLTTSEELSFLLESDTKVNIVYSSGDPVIVVLS